MSVRLSVGLRWRMSPHNITLETVFRNKKQNNLKFKQRSESKTGDYQIRSGPPKSGTRFQSEIKTQNSENHAAL